MSKFNNYDNPYKYPQEEWYIFNDVTYLCDILADKANYPIESLDAFYNQYAEATDSKSMKIELYSFLLELGIENPAEFDSPANGIADFIDNTPPENMPKVMYLLVHPDEKDVPSSFNAFTFPEYFPEVVDTEQTYQSQEVYSDVLKKALDVRNNKLDARTFNRGLSPEQVVALATNKLDMSKPAEVQAEEVVELPDETTSSKVESLKGIKNDKLVNKPQYNLNDLLNKEE
jgi:hypothetical protein